MRRRVGGADTPVCAPRLPLSERMLLECVSATRKVSVPMTETMAAAYARRPAASRHLTVDEYTERVPVPPDQAIGVLIDGVRLPFTGRRWRRSDRLGNRWVEAEAAGRNAAGRTVRVRVTHYTEPSDPHSPRRAGCMLTYPPTISDVEGMGALRWRAA